jgi:hypothetical protein
MDQPYRTHAHVSEDGTLVLSNLPFAVGEQVEVILRAEPSVEEQPALQSDALAVLEKLIGTVEAPSDWAAKHDRYLYGTESEMRDEYDFSPEELRKGVRGKYAPRFAEGVNLVAIDPDLTDVFPDSEAVNQALRAMASVIRARSAA